MRANCWNGITDVRIEQVPDPRILNARDIVIRIDDSTYLRRL